MVEITHKGFEQNQPREFLVEAVSADEASGKAMAWVLKEYPNETKDFGVSIDLTPLGPVE